MCPGLKILLSIFHFPSDMSASLRVHACARVCLCVCVCVCVMRWERGCFFLHKFGSLHSVYMLLPTVFKFQNVLQRALFSIYLNWVHVLLENDAVYRSEHLLTFVSRLERVLW